MVVRRRFLAVLAVAAVAGASTLPAPATAADGARTRVKSLEFRGEVTFPTGTTFAGTQLGGLSSITYDERRDVYYAVSDDQGTINPVRWYTLKIDVSDGRLDAGDVRVVDVTTALDISGLPYVPGSLDPEGLALGPRRELYLSSEGKPLNVPVIQPFIRRYDRSGRVTAELAVPAHFLTNATGTQGVRNNLGFESLAVTPDGESLLTANEGALVQDGPAADLGRRSFVRILRYDLDRTARPAEEYVYVVDPVAEPPVPANQFRVNGIVELLPLDDDGTALAMERSFSVGARNTVKIHEISTRSASDVAGIDDLFDETTGTPAAFTPVSKRFLFDFADVVPVVDNIEGLTMGPRLPGGKRAVIAVSDNNFAATQFTQFVLLAADVRGD